MPTLNLQIAAAGDDRRQLDGATNSSANSSGNFSVGTGNTANSPNQHNLFRFGGAPPQGATINSATFILTKDGGTFIAVQFNIYGENINQSTSVTGRIDTRPKTTASTGVNVNQNWVNNTEYGWDVTSIIQELVNRPGWTGTNIVIITQGAGPSSFARTDFYEFNESALLSAKLVIEYTEPGGGTTPVESDRVLAWDVLDEVERDQSLLWDVEIPVNQHRTDFSEYTSGAQPSDWTERWDTGSKSVTVEESGIPTGGGSKALKLVGTSTARYALSWDAVGTPSGDVETLTRIYYEHTSDQANFTWSLMHGGGSADSEDSYRVLLAGTVGAANWRIAKFVGGTATNLATVVDANVGRGVWLWIRQGYDDATDTLRAKVWAGAFTDEPLSWQAAEVDTSLAGGWVGIGRFTANGTTWIDFFSVGTNGFPAPAPLVAVTSERAPRWNVAARMDSDRVLLWDVETDDALSNPQFASMGAAGPLDNLSPDGFSWAQARVLQVDQHGNLLALAQDNAGNKNIDFVWSNDGGATWSASNLGEGFILRGHMAIVGEVVHVLWLGQFTSDGLFYRRYQISYSGTSISGVARLDGGTVNLVLDNDASLYEHPWIEYIPETHALLCLWGAQHTGAELRASMRLLSDDGADGTAGNWVAPIAADTSGIGQSPNVAYSIIASTSTLPYFAAARKRANANAGDVYVVYRNGANYSYRRMQWDGAADWSDGLTAAQTVSAISRAGSDGGYSLKYQLTSQLVEDETNDRVYVGLVTWKDNTAGDTWSFSVIDSSDIPSALVDVYSATAAESAADNFVTGDLSFDQDLRLLAVSYTDLPAHHVYVAVYDGSTLEQAATLAWSDGAADIPTLLDGRHADKLHVLFRDFNGTNPGAWSPPYQGYYGTMDWSAAGLLAVDSDRVLAWDVAAQMDVDRDLIWDIHAALDSDRVLTFDTHASVSVERDLIWDVRTALDSDRILVWAVRSTVSADRALLWDLLSRVDSDRQLPWTVLSAVASDQGLLWDVAAHVDADRVLLWDVASEAALTPVEGDRQLLWTIDARVDIDRIVSWDALATVDVAQDVLWDVRVTVSTDRQLLWDSLQLIDADRVLLWNIDSALVTVESERVLAWDMQQRIDVERPALWNVHARLEIERQLLWNALVSLNADRGLLWDILTDVAIDRTLRWNVRARLDVDRVLIWHAESLIVITFVEGRAGLSALVEPAGTVALLVEQDAGIRNVVES